jgi:hypothetical protein
METASINNADAIRFVQYEQHDDAREKRSLILRFSINFS